MLAAGLVLAGCAGTGETESEAPAPAESEEETGGSAEAASGSITVWHYSTDDSQLQILADYKEIFESQYEGMEVENVYVPYDQMLPKLATAALSLIHI